MERVLAIEAQGFLLALAVCLVFQMLTGRINLRGLLMAKNGSGQVTPGRVQLLLATFAAGAHYLSQVAAASGTGKMPDVGPEWLYLFGGSSGIYALEKAWGLRNKS